MRVETNQLVVLHSLNMNNASSDETETFNLKSINAGSTNTNSASKKINLTRTAKVKSYLRWKFTVDRNLTWTQRLKNTSIPIRVLFVWSLFEIIICVIVLRTRSENNVGNFIGFCRKGECANYLDHALKGHIILSILTIVGILGVKQNFHNLRICSWRRLLILLTF